MRQKKDYATIEIKKTTRTKLKLFVAKKGLRSYDQVIVYMLGRLSNKNRILGEENGQ